MNKVFIKKVATWNEPEDNGEGLEALRNEFGGRAARRMTRLGMMMSHVLKQMPIQEGSSLVYATTFSETCAIEKYLGSFPYPSPLMFQTSIHPSGAEQYLIQNKQAVREFYPLAGGNDLLVRALECIQRSMGETLVLCGGEERGTWLRKASASSEVNYAWALELSHEDTGAQGSISWQDGGSFSRSADLLIRFLESLVSREHVYFECEGTGYLELDWRE